VPIYYSAFSLSAFSPPGWKPGSTAGREALPLHHNTCRAEEWMDQINNSKAEPLIFAHRHQSRRLLALAISVNERFKADFQCKTLLF
jgi:hypothetical protein